MASPVEKSTVDAYFRIDFLQVSQVARSEPPFWFWSPRGPSVSVFSCLNFLRIKNQTSDLNQVYLPRSKLRSFSLPLPFPWKKKTPDRRLSPQALFGSSNYSPVGRRERTSLKAQQFCGCVALGRKKKVYKLLLTLRCFYGVAISNCYSTDQGLCPKRLFFQKDFWHLLTIIYISFEPKKRLGGRIELRGPFQFVWYLETRDYQIVSCLRCLRVFSFSSFLAVE